MSIPFTELLKRVKSAGRALDSEQPNSHLIELQAEYNGLCQRVATLRKNQIQLIKSIREKLFKQSELIENDLDANKSPQPAHSAATVNGISAAAPAAMIAQIPLNMPIKRFKESAEVRKARLNAAIEALRVEMQSDEIELNKIDLELENLNQKISKLQAQICYIEDTEWSLKKPKSIYHIKSAGVVPLLETKNGDGKVHPIHKGTEEMLTLYRNRPQSPTNFNATLSEDALKQLMAQQNQNSKL